MVLILFFSGPLYPLILRRVEHVLMYMIPPHHSRTCKCMTGRTQILNYPSITLFQCVQRSQHHEEMYHNTPDTQTEDSYVHPEDIAHFAHHEDIEREEEDRIRKAQGLPPTDPNKPLDEQTEQPDHDEKEAAMFERQRAQFLSEQGMQQPEQQQVFAPASDDDAADNNISQEEKARMERSRSAQEQARKLKDQSRQAAERGAWGEGGEGFKKPKDKVDRLRDRIPYKYRVRSSFFGEF